MGNKKGTALYHKDDEIVKLYQSGLSSCKIAKIYNVGMNTICRLLENNGIERRSNKINSRKHDYNRLFFRIIDSDIKAYWLGFIFADGYIRNKNSNPLLGISLSSKDKEHLEKFKTHIEYTGDIKEYKVTSGYKPGITYNRILLCGEEIFNSLSYYGLTPSKSLTVKAPKHVENYYYPSFIRGFFDGNGAIAKAGRTKNVQHYSIKISSTDNMLYFIKHQIELNGIATINKLTKRRPTDVVSSLEFGGNKQVLKFLHYIYDSSEVYLERKYDIFKRIYSCSVELSRNTKC